VVNIIELIQVTDKQLSKLLLSRTAFIIDMESTYTDNLLQELQGSMTGTEEVLRLKLLDQIMVICGHRLLEMLKANELEELVNKIANEDKRIADIVVQLQKTRSLLLDSKNEWQTASLAKH
jgi:hypothetical protein